MSPATPAVGAVEAQRACVAYIGVGANLGDPQQQLLAAFKALAAIAATRIVARSSAYRSAPVGGPQQPEYLNAVVCIETAQPARALLAALLHIESRHGRVRSVPNAPRTLDLDLLLYGEQSIVEPGLHVPHPRMHLRRFVLEPLLEIAPGIAIPGLGAAGRLLAAAMDQAVLRVDPPA